jgi:hypothetical protein
MEQRHQVPLSPGMLVIPASARIKKNKNRQSWEKQNKTEEKSAKLGKKK